MMDFKVPANSLIIFLDETGHELLIDPKYPIFGIGGCAVKGSLYNSIIKKPWNKMKDDYFGGLNVPLHAYDLHSITKEQIKALDYFFRTQQFSRFAALLKITTSIIGKITPYQIVSAALTKRFEKIASYYRFNSIIMIFESSSRTNFFTVKQFDHLRALIDNKEIYIEKYFMNKSMGEPGLEVADFIIHTSGSQVRGRLSGKINWRKDFESIFHSVDERLVSYLEINSASLCHKPKV